jgi:hypothetical protein
MYYFAFRDNDPTAMKGLAGFFLGLPVSQLITEKALAASFLDSGFTPIIIHKTSMERAQNIISSKFGEHLLDDASVYFILAYDAWPQKPLLHKQVRHGVLDNQRILKAIQKIGKNLNGLSQQNGHRACLNAGLNGVQAIEFVRRLGMNSLPLLKLANDIDESLKIPASALKSISSTRLRARLDVIECSGRSSVRKTFLPSFANYALRECEARENLAPILSFVDEVIDSGENFFVTPLYKVPNVPGPNSLRLVSISHARVAIDVMRGLYECGYASLDCNPHSIVYDFHGNPRVIDLEYIHRYETRPGSFEASYDIKGLPKDSKLPGAHIAGSFDQRWKPWIGVSYDDLMRQPISVLRTKRLLFVVTHRLPRLMTVTVRDFIRIIRDFTIGIFYRYLLRKYPNYLGC